MTAATLKRKGARGPKAAGGLRWTILRAADECGVPREAVRRGLRAAGIEPGKDGRYTTRQIFQALHGDLEAERIRETRARAELLEMEAEEKRRTLVSVSGRSSGSTPLDAGAWIRRAGLRIAAVSCCGPSSSSSTAGPGRRSRGRP